MQNIFASAKIGNEVALSTVDLKFYLKKFLCQAHKLKLCFEQSAQCNNAHYSQDFNIVKPIQLKEITDDQHLFDCKIYIIFDLPSFLKDSCTLDRVSLSL